MANKQTLVIDDIAVNFAIARNSWTHAVDYKMIGIVLKSIKDPNKRDSNYYDHLNHASR